MVTSRYSSMGAPRLLSGQRRVCDRLRDLDHEVELQRSCQLGVERTAGVLDLDSLEPVPQRAELLRELLEALSSSKDARAHVHVVLKLLADRADPLLPTLLIEERRLDP